MKEFWNERYAQAVFAYGKEPNAFLKESLDHLALKGKSLFAAEGEGRNAVFAAEKGMEVYAFDISEEGKTKALLLAKEKNVSINYQVENISTIDFEVESFDALVLIYAHFPENLRKPFHQKLSNYLKPGAYVILEGFSKKHIEYNTANPQAGGPKDVTMLFSLEEIKEDFAGFEIIKLEETETDLTEGMYHVGKSAVIRFIGRKK